MSDLETLRGLTLTSDDGRYTKATPCVRIDWLCDSPLSTRPDGLDALLTQAAKLIGDSFTFYGSEGPWAYSRKRKPKPSDTEQLGRTSELLLAVSEKDRIERQSFADQQAQRGEKPGETDIQGQDGGSLCLSDAFPMAQSGSHVQLLGYGDWRMSLSFSLDVYEAMKPDILKLAEQVFASGIPQTGNFGYALNSNLQLDNEARALVQPMTRRFPLLSPIEAGVLKWSNPFEGRRGLYPINSWTYHDKALLKSLRIKDDKMRALKDKVHDVQETEHGFLIKLFPEPILGDRNHGADLSPAYALGRVLEPAMRQGDLSSLVGIRVGPQADRWTWHMRFAREP